MTTAAVVAIVGLAVWQYLYVPYADVAGQAAAHAPERSAQVAQALEARGFAVPEHAAGVGAGAYGAGYVVGAYSARAVHGLPAIFYILALWAARSLFAGVAQGRLYQDAVVRGVGRVGRYLILASLAALVLGVLSRGRTLAPDLSQLNTFVPTLAVLFIGAALHTLSRLLRRAAAMEAELESII
jgi:hypothetical protein